MWQHIRIHDKQGWTHSFIQAPRRKDAGDTWMQGFGIVEDGQKSCSTRRPWGSAIILHRDIAENRVHGDLLAATVSRAPCGSFASMPNPIVLRSGNVKMWVRDAEQVSRALRALCAEERHPPWKRCICSPLR